MGDAQFCFAPAEDGFSKRVVEAAAFGCIPVIVQDGTEMPFEEVLPYDQFSVRVSEKVRSLSHPGVSRLGVRNIAALQWEGARGREANPMLVI
jgi:hypothetical protein